MVSQEVEGTLGDKSIGKQERLVSQLINSFLDGRHELTSCDIP